MAPHAAHRPDAHLRAWIAGARGPITTAANWFHAFLVCLCLQAPADVSAHHEPEHRVFAIGIPVRIPFGFTVCDTEEQLAEIVAAHALDGYQAAERVFSRLLAERNERGEARCGTAVFPVVVIDSVIAEAIRLDFPQGQGSVTMVWMHVPHRPDIRGVAALPDVIILPAGDAHLLDIPSSV